MTCEYCKSTLVISIGNDSYCAGCFKAGAKHCDNLWDRIQKHIKEDIIKERGKP